MKKVKVPTLLTIEEENKKKSKRKKTLLALLLPPSIILLTLATSYGILYTTTAQGIKTFSNSQPTSISLFQNPLKFNFIQPWISNYNQGTIQTNDGNLTQGYETLKEAYKTVPPQTEHACMVYANLTYTILELSEQEKDKSIQQTYYDEAEVLLEQAGAENCIAPPPPEDQSEEPQDGEPGEGETGEQSEEQKEGGETGEDQGNPGESETEESEEGQGSEGEESEKNDSEKASDSLNESSERLKEKSEKYKEAQEAKESAEEEQENQETSQKKEQIEEGMDGSNERLQDSKRDSNQEPVEKPW